MMPNPHLRLPNPVSTPERDLLLLQGHQLWGRVKVTTGAGKVKDKHRKVVMVVGMLGWIAKGVVYAIIGGQVSNIKTRVNS